MYFPHLFRQFSERGVVEVVGWEEPWPEAKIVGAPGVSSGQDKCSNRNMGTQENDNYKTEEEEDWWEWKR